MEFQHIDLNQTHIRLTTDLKNNNLEKYILNLRKELEHYIAKNKDFKLADEIRNELLEKGIVLEDTRQGVKWRRA